MPAGVKRWAPYDRLNAEDLNAYLSDQVIPVLANAAARNAAIPSPVAGQLAYLTDVAALTIYQAGRWTSLDPARAGVIFGQGSTASPASATATIPFGSPAGGDDPLGYWRAADGFAVIPAGLGGLYLLTAAFIANSNSAEASVTRIGPASPPSNSKIIMRGPAGVQNAGQWDGIFRAAAGLAMHFEATSHGGTTTNVRVNAAQLIRLGPDVGALLYP